MMNKFTLLTLLALSKIFILPSAGMYLPMETRDIPIGRILTNLELKAKDNPGDAVILHQLARTHAIAFSRKLDEADPVTSRIQGGGPLPQPWFGFEPPHVPFRKVVETENKEELEIAMGHLKEAIATYKKALAIKPDDNTMKLGLAWCQEQAGNKEKAIDGYREVAAAAWEKESKSGGGLGNFLYVETVDYLIPLLDEEEHAEDIAKMEARKKKLLDLPRAVTPIVIPVGNQTDLNQLVDQDARVAFDLDGTGRQLEWPWITPDAAWLVHDPRETGVVTSSIQMFGSRTFLLFCNNGYEALSLLDDDRDGSIAGEELEGLALWHDRNSNGISESGEVQPVENHHIRSLSVRSETHATGIPFSKNGVTLDDGSKRPTYDLILQSK